MFNNLVSLCNEQCNQANFYLITRSVLVLMAAGFLIALYKLNKLEAKNIQMFVVSLVLIFIYYHVITFACDKSYNKVAWLLASLPLLMALIGGLLFGMSGIMNILQPNLQAYKFLKSESFDRFTR
jgi:hypothetical protein